MNKTDEIRAWVETACAAKAEEMKVCDIARLRVACKHLLKDNGRLAARIDQLETALARAGVDIDRLTAEIAELSRENTPGAMEKLAEFWGCFPIERARELAKAERDGRLVVLLCKVGDTVWEAWRRSKKVVERKVMCVRVGQRGVWWYDTGTSIGFSATDIDRTVFLTREEAEAALTAIEEAANAKDQ